MTNVRFWGKADIVRRPRGIPSKSRCKFARVISTARRDSILAPAPSKPEVTGNSRRAQSQQWPIRRQLALARACARSNCVRSTDLTSENHLIIRAEIGACNPNCKPDFGEVDPADRRGKKPQAVTPVTGASGRFWHTTTIKEGRRSWKRFSSFLVFAFTTCIRS